MPQGTWNLFLAFDLCLKHRNTLKSSYSRLAEEKFLVRTQGAMHYSKPCGREAPPQHRGIKCSCYHTVPDWKIPEQNSHWEGLLKIPPTPATEVHRNTNKKRLLPETSAISTRPRDVIQKVQVCGACSLPGGDA